MNYYNDNDPKCCAWLRELIAAKLIPNGKVDCRSITDVSPGDLAGFRQCHWFAGIGGWPYALKLAGWPEDREVWTGSCPCQPLSCAGQQRGHADERHLWPAFYRLISVRRPSTIFGEQVASTLGREWFAGIRADLENLGYASGAADLCAPSIGAPHIRQRLYWVAHSTSARLKAEGNAASMHGAEHEREQGRRLRGQAPEENSPECRRNNGGLGNAERCRCEELRGNGNEQPQDTLRGRDASGLGHTSNTGLERRKSQPGNNEPEQPPAERTSSFWGNAIWHACRDGKARRVSPGEAGIKPVLQRVVDGFPGSLDNRRAILNALAGFPLTEGIRGRVTLLKGYGNAIVPQLAAEFVKAFLEL